MKCLATTKNHAQLQGYLFAARFHWRLRLRVRPLAGRVRQRIGRFIRVHFLFTGLYSLLDKKRLLMWSLQSARTAISMRLGVCPCVCRSICCSTSSIMLCNVVLCPIKTLSTWANRRPTQSFLYMVELDPIFLKSWWDITHVFCQHNPPFFWFLSALFLILDLHFKWQSSELHFNFPRFRHLVVFTRWRFPEIMLNLLC